MRKSSWRRRWVKRLLKGMLAAIAMSAAPVLIFRVFPPPASALMVERRIQSWFGTQEYSARYDWVPMDRIAPVMGVAVIAAEDQRFPEHYGFDFKAIERAIAYNQENERTRGASTISQQTAKNLFLWSGRAWTRKAFEAYFTVLIEVLWPKSRTLEVYLNIVEFGDGVYGVEAASKRFFGKPAENLNSSEAALLAAVLPNPRRFKANAPSAYILGRQQWILGQIRSLGGPGMLKHLD